ncbi:MAG: hypothetical protein JO250_09160 [Armatimonadetes bacterium]|nr:hypothetical protein [Armatimonadota bacterium]
MFGTTTIAQVGRMVPASADGAPEYKAGGVTVDWTTVPPGPATDTTLTDGTLVPAGVQYLPFGVILTQITTSGNFGPYDAGANDGRQTLTRGSCYLLNYTYTANDPHADTVPGVFEGGRVFIARVKKLAAGAYVPGWDNVTVAPAFPRVMVVQ